jgi:hypothetical protein
MQTDISLTQCINCAMHVMSLLTGIHSIDGSATGICNAITENLKLCALRNTEQHRKLSNT